MRARSRREPRLRVTADRGDHRCARPAASWIAAFPTAPAPPATSTLQSPRAPGCNRVGPSSATVSARCAVTAGMPMLAPSSNPAPAGSANARSARTTVYSWAVPLDELRTPASVTRTRSPTLKRSTPAPSSSTTPAPSGSEPSAPRPPRRSRRCVTSSRSGSLPTRPCGCGSRPLPARASGSPRARAPTRSPGRV
jgi:hypothetical protein